jgi:molecular chaperone HtpG
MRSTETHQFQAETTQLLSLVVNSLYTSKDIFLRELISNASDALDRLRFEAVTRPELLPEGHSDEIRLEVDREARTLTIHDAGIGMSRDEVVANIGTIAQSGTRELLRQASEGASSELLSKLIGQFGVGFYSAFMVADQVTLVTRRAGEEGATLWESTGEGQFDLSEARRDGCGTTITLHLKPADEEAGLHDYADPLVLQRIVKRYSDFITHPVVCAMERTEVERDADGEIVDGAQPKIVTEDQILNAMRPIWARPSAEVGAEEFAEFYRHISHDWTEPLKTISLRAEGRLEYRALLFIPSQAPLDFGHGAVTYGLQLYAKSVMIMERCEDLLEPWLRFVRGVVDSADLPLNVSREMLQQDRHIVQIRKWLTGRILKDLGELRTADPERYRTFWRAFGRVLKEGMVVASEHRERLTELLLFSSSADPGALTSLADYVGRMKPDQKEIFYLTGESRRVLEGSPHLEAFSERDYEVLLLTDPVDVLMVETLTEFGELPVRSAARGALDLGDDAERGTTRKELESRTAELGGLLAAIQKHLADRVREVRLSSRLTTSPAVLVAGDHDLSPQLQRMLRGSQMEIPVQLRILELNPKHPVVDKLAARFAVDAADTLIGETAELLLASAMVAEGSDLPDPARFNTLLVQAVERGLETHIVSNDE